MKIAIQPINYRISIGTYLQILEFRGNPPVNIQWEITSDTGTILKSGEILMSDDEWANWPAGEDNNYAERIVAAYLGVALLNP